jgi:ADP-ribosylglycohydrolase
MAPAHGRRAAITDDTQMTLFTAEGLLRAYNRFAQTGMCSPPAVVEHAYFRWLWTQGESVPAELQSLADGPLFEDLRLHEERAPGNTCISALRARVRARLQGKEVAKPLNDSKGCGGVMRVAPVGLVADEPWELGSRCAELTHAHPAGHESAGLLAEIVGEVVAGRSLAEAAARVWKYRRDQCHADTRRAIDRAFALLHAGEPASSELLETLGGGWVGEEALAIALYCALACPDLPSAMSLAVTHSGDSDSTGAIVGNLLGAALGEAAIPGRWLEELELRDLIERIAEDLAKLRLSGRVDERVYPGS